MQSCPEKQCMQDSEAKVLFLCKCSFHGARTGRTSSSEVRHARWKIPLQHFQNKSTVSTFSLRFHAIFDLSNLGLLLSLIHLPVPVSSWHHPHADFIYFHQKLDLEGRSIHGGIDFNAFFFPSCFSPSFLSWQVAQREEKRRGL